MGCWDRLRCQPSEILMGWIVIILTALAMALANLATVFSVEYLVTLKFNIVELSIENRGLVCGIFVLMASMAFWATLGAWLVQSLAPEAGGSGSAENKGWLNGFDTARFFSVRTLLVRFVAVIIFNTTGYPCGREGPTVTQGSGLAFLFCKSISSKHKSAREYLDLRSGAPGAVRMGCVVGGACGMAMIFDSPIGGILYMFEEVGPAAWPAELTFKAFVGCVICTTVSYGLLAMAHTTIRRFVIFEMWYGPSVSDYSSVDIPGFFILSFLLGLLAPLHTFLCLKVLALRKRWHGETALRRCQPWAKIGDACIFAIFCALVTSLAAWNSRCYPNVKTGEELSLSRFDCSEGHFNPVASLLLTTPDAAVKLLFNRDNFVMTGRASAIALTAYFTMNVCFTGLPVPTGNFTGSMLIGGMAGRLLGCALSHYFPAIDFASNGVYSMVGAAAMLSSFKQMSVACVLFISGAANNVDLVPPLMLAVSISLFVSRATRCTRPWDEEQVILKKVPFLPSEFCKELTDFSAKDLMDALPPEAMALKSPAEVKVVEAALKCCEAPWFPLLEESAAGPRCVALLGRPDLEKLLRKQQDEELLQVAGCAEPAGIQIVEGTPAASLYPLFSQAHVQAACVVTASGCFRGIISRAGLAEKTTAIEVEAEEKQLHHADQDTDTPSDSDSVDSVELGLRNPRDHH